jgi:DNA-binding PadR family transcriptional regulator
MTVYAEILILGQLLTGPKHGYEIKKNIQEAGAISKEVVKVEGKPNRHVYFLTDVGEEIFNEMIRDFPSKLAASQSEFLVRVALFDRLEQDMQQEILKRRQEVLLKKLDFYRYIEAIHPKKPFVIEVVRFQKSQVEHELAWIEALRQKGETLEMEG